MKCDEKLAQTHLTALDPKSLRYEPNGASTAPDFEVSLDPDGKIGVEVRRLNLNRRNGLSYTGLENDGIPLFMEMKKLVSHLQTPSEHRWYLSYSFARSDQHPRGPLSQWPTVKKYVQLCLENTKRNQSECVHTFGADHDPKAPETLRTLEFLRLGEPGEGQIRLGAIHDLDTAGWCSHLLSESVRICLLDKTPKRREWSSAYSQCWLVLLDYVGHGIPEDIQIKHDWDKLIVINPEDPLLAYEL